jgi:dimethylargininase
MKRCRVPAQPSAAGGQIFVNAYIRTVSPLIAGCELTHVARAGIDAARATAQHAAYAQALEVAGCTLHTLPDLPGAPDGVFVEDTALLLDGVAIITRPGPASRAGETASVAATLAARLQVRHLAAGRLEGGDVLRVGQTLYVGQSSRTDAAGFEALGALAGPLGFRLVPVQVHGCLHLKTAVTCIGDADGSAVLVINPAWVDAAPFADTSLVTVHPDEPFAGNTLRIGATLLVAAGAPRTRAALDAMGFSSVALDISELQKAEAGLTCMSLVSG